MQKEQPPKMSGWDGDGDHPNARGPGYGGKPIEGEGSLINLLEQELPAHESKQCE